MIEPIATPEEAAHHHGFHDATVVEDSGGSRDEGFLPGLLGWGLSLLVLLWVIWGGGP